MPCWHLTKHLPQTELPTLCIKISIIVALSVQKYFAIWKANPHRILCDVASCRYQEPIEF